jgi:hypothetical protein
MPLMSLICISNEANFCLPIEPNSRAVFTVFTISFEEFANAITSAFEACA